MNSVNYLEPEIPSGLSTIQMKTIVATNESLGGFGQLVNENEYQDFQIEIVRWPATGTRPVDPDTGDEAGCTEGVFLSYWQGDVLYGKNEAVDGHYILGYNREPELADEEADVQPERIMLWHANYHPDGGQMFYPLDGRPFVVPLALPGDDIKPDDFVCFWFDGTAGLYIHPNIWHEGVFTCSGQQRFFDRQGAVHARVSVNFPEEFQCLLEAPLSTPG